MKVSKSLFAVIAMAGTMGFSAVASAMDISVYGSIRAGYNQTDTDDYEKVNNIDVDDGTPAFGSTAAIPATGNVVIGNADNAAAAVAGDKVIQTATTESPDAQTKIGHGIGSRIGIKGSEDLGNGASSGFVWEVNVGGAGDTGGGRHANAWYSGAFGKITIGQQFTPYTNAANWDQSVWLGGNADFGNDDLGVPSMRDRFNGIRYDGGAGAFNFSVAAAAVDNPRAKAEENVYTITTDSTAATGAPSATADVAAFVTENAVGESETGIDMMVATGHYDMGVAQVNLGYYTNTNDGAALGDSYDAFAISAQGTLDALSWYVGYQAATDNYAGAKGSAIFAGDAVVSTEVGRTAATTAGAVTRAAANEDAYASTQAYIDSVTTNQDVTTIGLFIGYNISDVSLLYLEWEDSANDGLDVLGENLDRTQTLLGFTRKLGPNTSFVAEYAAVDNNSELTADSTTLQGYLKVDF